MTVISCDDSEKYLEFSIEPFNMALQRARTASPDLSWQKNFDRLNKCSN
jgi:hypothetical protein